MDRIAVLFIGDVEWSEFREVHQWLAERASLSDAPDLSAALTRLENGRSDPTLIVLAQRWPGEFSVARIDRLRQAAPLASAVLLEGPGLGQRWSALGLEQACALVDGVARSS